MYRYATLVKMFANTFFNIPVIVYASRQTDCLAIHIGIGFMARTMNIRLLKMILSTKYCIWSILNCYSFR
jgi:hypothetical protein